MRHLQISAELFVQHRAQLAARMAPNSLAVVNANDVLPTNADGSLMLVANSDLFHLSGIEQEESILLIYPEAFDPKLREVLFLREPNEELAVWEGHKHTAAQAKEISGIATVKWLHEFPKFFRQLMCDAEVVYLNSNEHKRSTSEVETRDARFVRWVQGEYPLHEYRRLAKLMHPLRVVKSDTEIELLKRSVEITVAGFRRVARYVRPNVTEFELEAEFAHEFIRNRAKFAYTPIIASGKNACTLHYIENSAPCRDGELVLLDVAASYANYNADLTRTLPVNGRFTPRQRAVYEAVLRVMNDSIARATVGTYHRDWQRAAELQMNDELLALGVLTQEDISQQTEDRLASRKYFNHGLGHVLGLDVHDVGDMSQPFAPGWVLTVEPGIYLPEEGIGVRLEDDVVVTNEGPVNLMAHVPVTPDEIETLMCR